MSRSTRWAIAISVAAAALTLYATRAEAAATTGAGGSDPFITAITSIMPEADWPTGYAIVICESGGDPTADNPTSTARGGWQIIEGTWEWVRENNPHLDAYPAGPDDPWQSTEAALWLANTYTTAGLDRWAAWNASRACWAGTDHGIGAANPTSDPRTFQRSGSADQTSDPRPARTP